jgi:hypothetical protein
MAAEHQFGPLRLVGNVDLDEGSLERNALEGIDQDTFARLDDVSSIQDLLARPSFHHVLPTRNPHDGRSESDLRQIVQPQTVDMTWH